MPSWTKLAALALALALSGAQGPALAEAPTADAEAPPPETARGEAYAHLMRSLLAARRGEFRVAAAEVRRAIKLQPDAPEVYIEGASLLRSMGRFAEAEQLARQALTVDATNADALHFLADQAADRALATRPEPKLIEEALELYEQLARVRPLDEESLHKRTNLLMLSGDVDSAIASARALFDERPGSLEAAQKLYRLLVHGQQEEEALEVLLRFLVRHPDERLLIEEAERMATRLEAWELVVRHLDGEDGLGNRACVAQALRGQALLRLGRVEDATEPLERALAADSQNRRLRLGLVVAYRSVGRLADAAGLARRLADEDSGDPMFLLLLAETLDQQRDVDAAMERYGSALELMSEAATEDLSSDRDAIRLRLAELYLGREDFDQAREQLAALEQSDVVEHALLEARVALSTEDWDLARGAAQRLGELGPTGEAELIEGEILLRSGRATRAEAKFRSALQQLGDRRRWSVARLYQENGQAETGELLLREWVERAEEDPDAWFDLGRYLYMADRFGDAEDALSRTVQLEPQHAPALNFLGYSYAERNTRLDEALNLIERALSVDAWDGAYLDSLGWVYYQMGRYSAARDPLERAAREYPRDPTILEHLGDVYDRLGEDELALLAWRRALDAEPENSADLQGKIRKAVALGSEATERTLDGDPPPREP